MSMHGFPSLPLPAPGGRRLCWEPPKAGSREGPCIELGDEPGIVCGPESLVLLLASPGVGTRCASPGRMRPLGPTDALSPHCGHPALAWAPVLFQLSVNRVS